MMKSLRSGLPSLFKDGTKQFTGIEETALKNIQACIDLANITRTSYGPNGLNKMVINHLQKLFITSNTATILKESDIIHPAAKMVILAVKMQEKEVGDGCNFVIIFAGELCQMAEELIKSGVHTKDIARGFNMARKKIESLLNELCCRNEKNLKSIENLTRSIKTSVASKFFVYESFLSKLIAEACFSSIFSQKKEEFDSDNIRVFKVLGGKVNDSEMVKGMVFEEKFESNWKDLENVRIALFACSIDLATTETKGTILIKNADELMNYKLDEESLIEKFAKSLSDLNVNLVITGASIGEMALHYLKKHNIASFSVRSKFELRRICKLVNCRPFITLNTTLNKESFGFCDRVFIREIGGKNLTFLTQKSSNISTLLLRGSSQNVLLNIEHAVNDGVNTIGTMFTRDSRFVYGGGAFEMDLSKRLKEFAAKEPSVAHHAIHKYAEAFEVFPRLIAESCGLNDTLSISELISAQNNDEKSVNKFGVNVEKAQIGDMSKECVEDLLYTKWNAIKLATDAVTTIIRIDNIVMSKPAGGPKMGQRSGHWDED